jgi:hypothetical protein
MSAGALAAGTVVSTPYLDATMNVALAVFAIGLAGIALKRAETRRPAILITAVTAALTIGLIQISIAYRLASALPTFLRLTQFLYRLVSYVDLTLLCGTLALLMLVRRLPVWLVAGALTLSGSFLVAKLHHGAYARDERAEQAAALTPSRLPRQFNGFSDYQVRLLYPELVPGFRGSTEKLAPARARFTPELAPVPVTLKDAGWVETNVQPFPWMTFKVDGKAVAPADLRITSREALDVLSEGTEYRNRLVAVPVPAGSHVLEAASTPPEGWLWGRRLSMLVLLLWIGATGLLTARARRSPRATPAQARH